MNVIGHGIDIVEVDFFRRLCAEPDGAPTLARYFTSAELERAGHGPNRPSRLAGRFAAKEAVLKALGVGLSRDIGLPDVEIGALPSGAPVVILHAHAAEVAAELGIANWLVSISHTEVLATGSALALS